MSDLYKRLDYEPPIVISRFGWRFHHIGIPTTQPHPEEQYLPDLKMYVAGFPSSPFGVEWMRFEPRSPVADIVQRVPHVAFEVDDLEVAIAGRTLLGEVSSPSPGVRVAMFLHDGALIEIIEFEKANAFGN